MLDKFDVNALFVAEKREFVNTVNIVHSIPVVLYNIDPLP